MADHDQLRVLIHVPEIVLFYAARALGLLTRPLTLWLLVRLHAQDASTFLATYYFVVGATFIALNSEAHIPFYKAAYGDRRDGQRQVALAFRTYCYLFSSHLLAFLGVLFLFFLLYFHTVASAAAFALFVVLEKIWDEIQRSLLFARRYRHWSMWFIAKSLAPLTAVGMHLMFGWNLFALMLVSLLLVSAIMIRHLVPARVARVCLRLLRRACHMRLGTYWRLYRSRFVLGQVIALTSVNLVNVDKWLAPSAFGKPLLVELVLLSQFGVAYLVALDNIFFSRQRDRYVRTKTRIADITHWPLLLGLSTLYLLCVGLSVGSLPSLLGLRIISPLQATLAAAAYMAVGISKPLVEHAFWHAPRHMSATLDCASFVMLVVLAYGAVRLGDLTLVFVASLSIILARLFCYWHLCRTTLQPLQAGGSREVS
jgi:hypothetical protein